MNSLYTSFLVFFIILFSGCSGSNSSYRNYSYSKPTTVYSSNKDAHSSSMDPKIYSHPTMRPYEIRGVKYYPTTVSVGDTFSGNASWYGPDFHGKLTSNGETYNMYDMTAAHKTLPMNTIVKVTNLRNNLSTVVRINDRGPFVETRIIDLSKTAASKINMIGAGTAPVKIEVLGFHVNGKRNIPSTKELAQSPKQKSLGYFSLQIGSFENINGAIATQEKYNNTDGYKTIIKDAIVGDRRLFKVLLIGFQSEEEARDYMNNNSQFKHSFIVGD
ncbi:MAG: septal ring lytic transglycosylase RlpA family protein [Campylobacterales bacterium]|nr:septal ring lytic transglycosylase RlpA family protein [Campylobacterales bacterium]